MKSETIRQATDAHGWVGLIISVPLFIVFWAGAITLFYPEVYRWSAMPHFPIAETEEKLPVNAIVENHLNRDDFDNSRPLTVILPNDNSPYMELHIPIVDDETAKTVKDAEGVEKKTHTAEDELTLNPHTGEVLTKEEPFQLGNFINQLHFSFKLPQGLYIVGLITFFFFVIVITGIVIQLKNLIRHFFLYRHNKKTRYQMNDMHNVVGVVSLPYTLMYALTGLMFNLHIVFEIPVLFLKYQGDTQVMFEDAGFASTNPELLNISHPMPNLDNLIDQVEQDKNAQIRSVTMYNYGDQNALIKFNGKSHDGFAKNIEASYEVSTASFPEALNDKDNIFLDGINVLFSMHYGNFAGLDMRFLYFILAVGVCGMIVAGNVLWIAKRQKQYQEYPKTIAVTRALTLGGCMGVMLATAAAFLLERNLPVAVENRSDLIEMIFGMVLFVSALLAFFNKNFKRYIAHHCIAIAGVLLVLVGSDFVFFGQTILTLSTQGYPDTLGVTLSMILFATMFAWISVLLLKERGNQSVISPNTPTSHAQTVSQ
ncbi:MAG: PepSY-associated TM helix domain-containing protein [Pseudomonadota bacterium]